MRIASSPRFNIPIQSLSTRVIAIPIVAVMAFLTLATSTFAASSVYFNGKKLAHDYLTMDGRNYVALDDIQGVLGLSVVTEKKNMLIGGTTRGTLSVDLTSHFATVGSQQIDFNVKMRQDKGLWFAPDSFLDLALGIAARIKPNTTDLICYPEVVSITPTPTAIVITSSFPPDFKTFELDSPPRRVIEINGAFLQGVNLNVPGAMLGTTGVAALRASQFKVEPPVVRVVVEWLGKSPPKHTLFPEQKTLSVLVGAHASNVVPAGSVNLLASGGGPDDLILPVNDPGYNPPAPVIDPPTGLGTFPIGPSSQDPSAPDPAPETQVDPNPLPPVDPEKFKGMEKFTLGQLGWSVDFGKEDKGLIVTIHTPKFAQISDFTLAGDKGMRLVLDLRGTYIPGDQRLVTGQGDVSQLRFAQFQPEVTRIVFDLSKVLAYDIQEYPQAGRIEVRFPSGDLSGKVIVIDPGHGGDDPGAVVGWMEEKYLNLKMALVLKGYLEEKGARVYLTRSSDCFVALSDRVAFASAHKADLFICVHNNATDSPTPLQGSLILYNDYQYMPLYRLTHRGIAARTGVPGLGPIADERGLYILRHCGMPVLFVEASFMTNSIDYARLTDAAGAYPKNIMMGVMDGILAYYQGRDLPPVLYPASPNTMRDGIFSLTGAEGGAGRADDSGSAWDNPPEAAPSDGSSDSEQASGDGSKADDSSSASPSTSDDDKEQGKDYHTKRGRGRKKH